MALTQIEINNNKQTFLDLISKIKIEGANIEGLVNFLLTNDFFIAPASTVYHGSFEGGLC